jgi:RimJ/RimL family protein N-acetyltransferase
MTDQISFQKLSASDLPPMRQWLNSDFVSRWYGKGQYSYQEVECKYLPRINGQTPTPSFLIVCAGEPVGYIQTYKIKDYPDYVQYVQPQENAAGVDMFIGAREYAHRGLGSAALGKFLREIVFRDAEIESCIVGPEPNNEAAIRCYEKAGFQYWKPVQIPGEPEPEYLMRVDRGRTRMGGMNG